jgi:hypothetical protein
MEFLNPLALVALAAAAIPLLIHLFNFRKPRRLDFSSLEFVRELQKTTMQRVRIKQWLLLLLRMLAIAFLVLAFARPTLTGDMASTVGGRASTSVAVVVDNSLSMTLRDAEGEYLRQAKDIAAGIAGELRTGDELFLVASGEEGRPSRYSSAAPAIEAVEGLEFSFGAEKLPQSVRRAGEALAAAANLNKEIYLLTDLQETSLMDTLRQILAEDVRVYLLPVGDRRHRNVAVTDVVVESRIIEVGQPVRISATLLNHGDEPLDGYVASVYLEGQRVAQASAMLREGIPTTVQFTATPQNRGWLSGVVEIEADAFDFDNARHFTLHVPERRKILLVRGEGQEVNFLDLALSPELRRGKMAFEVTTIPESGLAAAGLSNYDAVVLVGPKTLSSGESAALGRYVSAGGGLFFTPAAGSSSDDYDALFGSIGGGRFGGFSGSATSGRSIASFDRVDLEHPLFEGVFTSLGQRESQRVESPDVFQAMNYTAGSGSEQTLIRLSNGFPFLQEIRHGDGIVLLLAVAPTSVWSDLPVSGLFIPLLYRSMYYLSASESTTGEQLIVARDGDLRISGVSESEQLRIVGPDGMEYVPEQRSLFGAVLMNVEGDVVRMPGIYDVRSGNELVRRIAFNVDASESDLATLSRGEGAERLSNAVGADVDVIDVSGDRPSDIMRAVAARRTGVELWNLFLLLALLTLVAEMAVARRWRPEATVAWG